MNVQKKSQNNIDLFTNVIIPNYEHYFAYKGIESSFCMAELYRECAVLFNSDYLAKAVKMYESQLIKTNDQFIFQAALKGYIESSTDIKEVHPF